MAVRKIEHLPCDRCGMTVETRAGVGARDQAFGLHASGSGGATLDICPDCRAALLDWLGEGKPG
jgi:hypothetical protein